MIIIAAKAAAAAETATNKQTNKQAHKQAHKQTSKQARTSNKLQQPCEVATEELLDPFDGNQKREKSSKHTPNCKRTIKLGQNQIAQKQQQQQQQIEQKQQQIT